MYVTSNEFNLQGNKLTIQVQLESPELLKRYQPQEIGIYIDDGRVVTNQQRRKIYALMGELADWSGYTVSESLEVSKLHFLAYEQSGEWFSLSNRNILSLSVERASRFIDWLIQLFLHHNIPTKRSLLEQAEDIGKYLYMCLATKKCAICGQTADLHHWNAIGMGRDREQINHIGMKAIALCRKHHMEAHAIGKDSFADKYKVSGMTINEEIAHIWAI